MAYQPRIVNKQFNSPINLYSADNVKEVLDRETQMLTNGAVGINFHNPNVGKPANLQNSAVLKMLEEEQRQQQNGLSRGIEYSPKPLRDQIKWPPPEYQLKYMHKNAFKDVVIPGTPTPEEVREKISRRGQLPLAACRSVQATKASPFRLRIQHSGYLLGVKRVEWPPQENEINGQHVQQSQGGPQTPSQTAPVPQNPISQGPVNPNPTFPSNLVSQGQVNPNPTFQSNPVSQVNPNNTFQNSPAAQGPAFSNQENRAPFAAPNNPVPQNNFSNRTPLQPLNISAANTDYQQSPKSPVQNQSPVGFRPTTPTKRWAPVQSPSPNVQTPQSQFNPADFQPSPIQYQAHKQQYAPLVQQNKHLQRGPSYDYPGELYQTPTPTQALKNAPSYHQPDSKLSPLGQVTSNQQQKQSSVQEYHYSIQSTQQYQTNQSPQQITKTEEYHSQYQTNQPGQYSSNQQFQSSQTNQSNQHSVQAQSFQSPRAQPYQPPQQYQSPQQGQQYQPAQQPPHYQLGQQAQQYQPAQQAQQYQPPQTQQYQPAQQPPQQHQSPQVHPYQANQLSQQNFPSQFAQTQQYQPNQQPQQHPQTQQYPSYHPNQHPSQFGQQYQPNQQAQPQQFQSPQTNQQQSFGAQEHQPTVGRSYQPSSQFKPQPSPQQPSQTAQPAVAPTQVSGTQPLYNQKPVEPPPATINLRPQAPVSQAPPPVFSSQPATATLQGGKHLRGDLKWPPETVKKQAEEENRKRVELAKGPVCRPRRVNKDYTSFFAQHALNSTYPGYKAPPGTQF